MGLSFKCFQLWYILKWSPSPLSGHQLVSCPCFLIPFYLLSRVSGAQKTPEVFCFLLPFLTVV